MSTGLLLPINGYSNSSPPATFVAGGNLDDDSDASYVELVTKNAFPFADTHYQNDNAFYAFASTPPAGATYSGCRVRWSIALNNTADRRMAVFVFCHTSSSIKDYAQEFYLVEESGADPVAPTSPGESFFTGVLSDVSRPNQKSALMVALRSLYCECYLRAFSPISGSGATTKTARVYKAQLEYETPAIAAPLRLFPRRDNRAGPGIRNRRASPARVFPRQR